MPPLARVGRLSAAAAVRPRLGERSARRRISRSLALQSREETWEIAGKWPRSHWENRPGDDHSSAMHGRSRSSRSPVPVTRRRVFSGARVIGRYGDYVRTGPNRGSPGEADGESGALSRRAGEVDRAAVDGDDRGNDGEPSSVPPSFRVRPGWARQKRSKTRSCDSGRMPNPSSATTRIVVQYERSPRCRSGSHGEAPGRSGKHSARRLRIFLATHHR
jgi:hypothetical protein